MSLRRKLFVILCAAAGGTVFGVVASPMLVWIYEMIDRLAQGERTGSYRPQYEAMQNFANTAAVALIGVLVGAGLARVALRLKDRFNDSWERMDNGDKVTLFLGIFAGLIASMPFLFMLNSLQLGAYVPLAVAGLTVGFSALAVYALQTMDEVLPWYKSRGRSRKHATKILDTNVLIDGRIYDIVRTGFLESQLYVPGFVLDELQYIADSHDPLRRQRGRRGLDILRHLQADFNAEVRAFDKAAPDLGDGVDARLVRLARAMGADIVTNDFNLNRVAGLQQVRVLSINDLALALRSNVMPQETLALHVIREGNQPGQGVGYLEDGTMVVVENGKAHIGETLDVVVTQVIQTERGKMIFAEAGGEQAEAHEAGRRRTGARKTY